MPLWVRQALFIGGVLAIPAWLAVCPGDVAVTPDGGGLLSACAVGVVLIAAVLGLLARPRRQPPRR